MRVAQNRGASERNEARIMVIQAAARPRSSRS